MDAQINKDLARLVTNMIGHGNAKHSRDKVSFGNSYMDIRDIIFDHSDNQAAVLLLKTLEQPEMPDFEEQAKIYYVRRFYFSGWLYSTCPALILPSSC